MLTKEMIAALEADGKKLRQLTGEDHGPHTADPDCILCGGDGWVTLRHRAHITPPGTESDEPWTEERRPCICNPKGEK